MGRVGDLLFIAYWTAGKSTVVSLMRLKTLVKTVTAMARLISTICASV